ncbi:hypothetical protein PAAG_01414 [Paracoccidioides lutzii Pb01]|uniref:RNA polymerase II subunit B1 CTD phosphatase RPAP2 homolog n=1 Tax=Paracoccidioides lutzii (strain ATCC MYA-826 / Pb01) TaxID=502779 RepID=C1GSB9_PARBA|nr:hypothetical protein PAAG_01414 [Paracoccidioides lutzii Pb01]EEH38952.2 hypothetical protein PAAG_01414 [Paracoccidioides lutzii Pb01]
MANINPNNISPRISSNMKSSLPSIHAAFTRDTPPSTSPNSRTTRPTTTTTTPAANQRKPAPNTRHLAIALHHAHQIQARKDTESLILSRIEYLLSFPSHPLALASSPSPDDVKAFKEALLPFQPSDYDNLILERNIEGRCGYVLCSNEHRREDPKAKFRVVWGKKGSGPGGRGREMKVVPKEQIEKWCSDECAERAMYIRVQLIEQPAWERRPGSAVEILLLEEGRARRERVRERERERERESLGKECGEGKGKERERERESELVDEERVRDTGDIDEVMRKLVISDKSLDPEGILQGMDQLAVCETDMQMEESSSHIGQAALAIERGDNAPRPGLDAGRVGVNIFEKHPCTGGIGAVEAPSPRMEDLQGGSIEGFEPGQLGTPRPDAMDGIEEDNDILPTI